MAETFTPGQKVRLVLDVQDDETGYVFPAGAEGAFEQYLKEPYCIVGFDRSLGDPLDAGPTPVMLKLDAIEAA